MLDLDHFKYTNDSPRPPSGGRADRGRANCCARAARDGTRWLGSARRVRGSCRGPPRTRRGLVPRTARGPRGEPSPRLRKRRLTSSNGIALIDGSSDDLTADDCRQADLRSTTPRSRPRRDCACSPRGAARGADARPVTGSSASRPARGDGFVLYAQRSWISAQLSRATSSCCACARGRRLIPPGASSTSQSATPGQRDRRWVVDSRDRADPKAASGASCGSRSTSPGCPWVTRSCSA